MTSGGWSPVFSSDSWSGLPVWERCAQRCYESEPADRVVNLKWETHTPICLSCVACLQLGGWPAVEVSHLLGVIRPPSLWVPSCRVLQIACAFSYFSFNNMLLLVVWKKFMKQAFVLQIHVPVYANGMALPYRNSEQAHIPHAPTLLDNAAHNECQCPA